jgi:polyketide synthase PksN
MSVYHTLEDAGYAPASLRNSRTGVYIAAEENEYLQILIEKGVNPGGGFGHASSMIANHISYHFDFRGPSEFINAMCAGGALAIHRAVRDLRSGEISQAVAGAANLLLHPSSFVHLAGMAQLSPGPTVGSFGKNAQGYLRAEGVASILLKPLSRAEADGDSVYALIRNSAVNFNGREGMSIAAPNIAAHAELIHRCYSEAGADPRNIGYIEAQGMANPSTDIAEWEAFNRALGQLAEERGISLTPLRCGVSSLKPMAGHMHATSALGALFKIIRSLQTNRLHGILYFEQTHPDLDTRDRPCRLLGKTETWTRSERPRLAGLHSYSSGGSNAHLLVEEYVARRNRSAGETPPAEGVLIVLSADSRAQLQEMCGCLRAWIIENPSVDLSDLAWTLQAGRDARTERVAIQAASVSELLQNMEALLNGEENSRCRVGRAEGSCDRSEIDDTGLLDEIAEAWVRGVPIDWQRRYRKEIPHRLHIPCYRFDLKDYWFESKENAEAGEAEQFLNQLSEDQIKFLIAEIQVAGNHVEGKSGKGPKSAEPLNEKQIADAVRNVLTGTLRIDASAIGLSRKFPDYGIDSINGTRFIQALEKSLDLTIPPKRLFDHPSIEQLSRIIYKRNRPAGLG